MPDPNDVDEPSGTKSGPELDRRGFLNTTWKALGVVLIAEGAWTSYDILNPRSSQGQGSVVDAGPVGEYMEEGTVQYFLSGRFYVTQYQGGLRALYQKCPHLGCRVPFCDSSGQFECPCHGSFYNLIGEYIQGPAPRGMDRFKISISEDGRVLVDTATVLPGPAKGVLTGPNEASGPSCTSVEGEAAATPTSSGDTSASPSSASPDASPSGGAPVSAPPLDDPALRRSTRRWQLAGVWLLLILVLSFPMYKLTEGSRREDATAEQERAQIATGTQLWAANCAVCHGPMGEGVSAPALNSQEFLTTVTDAQIRDIMRGGIPGTEMPAWLSDYGGPLTEEQIQALVVYMRSWEATAPPRPDWRTPSGG